MKDATAGDTPAADSARATSKLARFVAGTRRWFVANTFAPGAPLPAGWRRGRVAYLLAVVVQLLAVVAVVGIVQLNPTFRFPEAALVVAVVIAALAWGAGPAAVGTCLGAILLDLLLTRPYFSLAIDHAEDGVGVALFLVVGVVISIAAGQATRARFQAEEAAAQMDELLSIISHELRNPLAATKANIQYAQRQARRLASGAEDAPSSASSVASARAPSVDILARADAQLNRMDLLIEDLLDASRARTGKLALDPAPCDLADIVREAVEEQWLARPDRTIALRLPEHPARVVADPRRVGQVVTNYLTNALKYSAADQPVDVRLALVGRTARVQVRDRGPGLPPITRERIWERGYRVPGISVRSGTGVGLGLGLYISRSIIARQHGQVGVQSAPGRGSTFWFTLPLAEVRGDDTGGSEATGTEPASDGRAD